MTISTHKYWYKIAGVYYIDRELAFIAQLLFMIISISEQLNSVLSIPSHGLGRTKIAHSPLVPVPWRRGDNHFCEINN